MNTQKKSKKNFIVWVAVHQYDHSHMHVWIKSHITFGWDISSCEFYVWSGSPLGVFEYNSELLRIEDGSVVSRS